MRYALRWAGGALVFVDVIHSAGVAAGRLRETFYAELTDVREVTQQHTHREYPAPPKGYEVPAGYRISGVYPPQQGMTSGWRT